MTLSTHRPSQGNSPRVASEPRERPGFATILLLAPIIAFTVGAIRVAIEPSWNAGYLAASIALPAIIVIALAVATRWDPARPIAAAALFVEAAVAGAFLPAGIAVAVILPIIAVGLVQARLRDRALLGSFVVAGTAAATGITMAALVGPAHGQYGSTPPILTIAAFVAIDVFALALVWRSTRDLGEALDHAQRQIAARSLTETELDRTSEILSAIVRSSPVATLAFGLDREVTLWNPAAERIFGWRAEDVLGQPLPEGMIPAVERASWAARIERMINGQVTNGDRVRRATRDGTERWVDIYAAPLRDQLGRSIGIAAQLVDVSERVELEAQLLQAQKMEAIGLLASGIAHDFNNTLTAAGGFAALIELNASEDEVRSDAREIVRAVDRARQLTGKLLAFGRVSESAVRTVDARTVVDGLAPLLRQLIGPETEIVVELATNPAYIRIDPGQLEQVLINLSINARDAMPGGGRLTLVVRPAVGSPIDPRSVELPDRVEIAVSDTGTGVPEEIRGRIFEPFFTTKGHGFGSGLGLAMVKGCVASAGGEVRVESVIDRGTTFTIRLPVHPAAASS
jgi:PAS domain S-box-containing protein